MNGEQGTRTAGPAQLPASRSRSPRPAKIVEFEALLEAHGGHCFSLARRILRDPHHAQDVVQEVFLEHWRSTSYDAARSTPRSWLLMLTHRKAVDRVRHEQRRFVLPPDVAPEQVSPRRGSEDLALAGVLSATVRTALSLLPRVQREALVLAYWGGFTQQEVAHLTGVPLGTAKGRMRDGMIALRKALSDQWTP